MYHSELFLLVIRGPCLILVYQKKTCSLLAILQLLELLDQMPEASIPLGLSVDSLQHLLQTSTKAILWDWLMEWVQKSTKFPLFKV